MPDSLAGTSFSTWAPPSSPARVEYSVEVLEEIRLRAVDGFYKLSRGGIEIAGLLLGSADSQVVRIVAQRPFEIEYAFGPVFLPSPADEESLRDLLAAFADPSSPEYLEAEGLSVVGFYVSHARSPLAVSGAERALWEKLFPEPWQFMLLLKPSRSPETEAAFCVRTRAGEIPAIGPEETFLLRPVIRERRRRPDVLANAATTAVASAAESPANGDLPRAPTGKAPASEAMERAQAPASREPTTQSGAPPGTPSRPGSPSAEPGSLAAAAPASPAPRRVASGRVLWTGHLATNGLLEIRGRDASHGILNLPLPGIPIHVNVHPAEWCDEGLVIYSANRRYRNAHSAIEAPGPANESNPTRYRYHPDRANALQVTTHPSEKNDWLGLAISNQGAEVSLIVIDWLAWEP